MKPKSKKTNAKEAKAIQVPLFKEDGSKAGAIELDKGVFNGEINTNVIYEAVKMYQANKRVGLASTKVRSEVEGGGKKPWRQKGTGRARFGSIRNPLWKGGGKVFGPHPRDFRYAIPKKVKKAALLSVLNSKIADENFLVIRGIQLEDHKTKTFVSILNKMKIEGGTIFAIDEKNDNLRLAARNLPHMSVVMYNDLNTLDIMKNRNFLVTEKGLQLLTAKLKGVHE